MFDMKGTSGSSTPMELNFRRSIDPPQPAPSSGDGYGEVRPQGVQSPARAGRALQGRAPLL